MINIVANINHDIIIQDDTFNNEEYIYVYIIYDKNQNAQHLVVKSPNQKISFSIGDDGLYLVCKIKVPLDDRRSCYYKKGQFYYDNNIIEAEDLVNVDTIEIVYYTYFSVCDLKACYLQLVTNLLSPCKPSQNLAEDRYKRDLLWSALNAIKILAEAERYDDAYVLLQKVSGCNGLSCNCN